MEAPDYKGIAARAGRGEYEHMPRPPIPDGVFPKPRGVLGHSFWPFGRDVERYLEKAGVTIPRDATSISLRFAPYEPTGEVWDRWPSVRVTIKRKRGKKRRYFIPAPVIDNMESLDT